MKFVLLLVVVCVLSGCADDVPYQITTQIEPVGFWYGLWHGMIAPFSFLVSLFDDNVAVYAVYNNGGWYNFGFVLGIASLSGSSSSGK
jgi:hypothetical protein